MELWWQDEARIGQKNKLTRRWARRGTRPRAPHDQRTAWAYLFGAICPAEGKGAGLVMPFCDTQAMQAHLAEISATVAPDAHAVLLLDQAGWHFAGALVVPGNITLLPLPPRSPELNPVENVWQFMRDNWTPPRTGFGVRAGRPTWAVGLGLFGSVTASSAGFVRTAPVMPHNIMRRRVGFRARPCGACCRQC